MPSKHSSIDAPRDNSAAPGAPAPGARLRAYGRLALGLILLALFLVVATIFDENVPALRTLAERIETYDLRPAAIYYTDHKAAAEGEAYIRSSLEYPPRKP